MQSYKDIQASDIIKDSRETINDNIKTAISNHSGTSFPTENLQVGMKCYRTDEGKTYTLTDVDSQTWVADNAKADSATNATHASTADSATKATSATAASTCTGNAASATKLANARTITITDGTNSGTATSFDGSGNVSVKLPSTIKATLSGNASTATSATTCTGNAATATKLATARTIALSGAATGTATSFNGTSNITIPVTSLDASKLTGTASVNTSGGARRVYPLGNVNPTEDGSTPDSGLTVGRIYNNNYPCAYGNVIRVYGLGSGELALGWSGADRGIERLYYRNQRDSSRLWSEWRAVAYTTDLTWSNVTSKPTLAKVSSWNSSTGVLALTST